jgi:mRNA interferase MazF
LLNQITHPSTLICPLTSQLSAEENILRVRVGMTETGIDQESEILVDQIRALDNQRFIEKLGKLVPSKTTGYLEFLNKPDLVFWKLFGLSLLKSS